MHEFYTVLEHINKTVYRPNELIITLIEEEKQNSEYAAGKFELHSESAIRTVRFRAAKPTPKKVGQFVTFWEKDHQGTHRPFQYENSLDLLAITTFKDNNTFGQFVFPKDILLKRNILQSPSTKGKMGIRVYPSWDKPTNNTGIKTQNWQLEYFFSSSDASTLPTAKILNLYGK